MKTLEGEITAFENGLKIVFALLCFLILILDPSSKQTSLSVEETFFLFRHHGMQQAEQLVVGPSMNFEGKKWRVVGGFVAYAQIPGRLDNGLDEGLDQ